MSYILSISITAVTDDSFSVLAGRTSKISCTFATKIDEFVIAWSLNGEPITVYYSGNRTTDENIRQLPSADQFGTVAHLEIPNVGFKDAGIYKCVRYQTNGIGPIISRNVRINVQGTGIV